MPRLRCGSASQPANCVANDGMLYVPTTNGHRLSLPSRIVTRENR